MDFTTIIFLLVLGVCIAAVFIVKNRTNKKTDTPSELIKEREGNFQSSDAKTVELLTQIKNYLLFFVILTCVGLVILIISLLSS